jgi:beta-lactamase regulating signal transducer with metallopeptidase domain
MATDWTAPSSPVAAAPATVDVAALLLVLWLGGAAAALVAVIVLHRRSLAKLGRLHGTEDANLLRSESRWSGPAVIGALRPRIVVPADFGERFTASEQAIVLTHERIHLARADATINAIVVLFQCLNWMNPLVHFAACLLRLDQEMACDAAVIGRHPEARRVYAGAMLKTQLAPLQTPLGCYWPARNRNPLKERFAMLKMKAMSRRRRYLGAAAVSLIVAAIGYGAWASSDEVRVATRDVVEVTARPAPARLAQAAPVRAEHRVDVKPAKSTAAQDRSPITERPLTEAEITALEGARAGLDQAYEQQRLAQVSVAEVAARAARLAELELALGQKSAAADEALRLAQADLENARAAYQVGTASQSDIGLAAERLVRLQLALHRPPTAADDALRLAEADIGRVREQYNVGLAKRSDIGLAAERLVRLQLALGRQPSAQARFVGQVQYSVAVSITDDGQIVGQPTLTIVPGGSAQVQSDGRYRVEATLMAMPSNKLKLQTTVSRPESGDWVVVARPTVTLGEGARAGMQMTGAGGNLIEIDIKPKVDRSPA